MVLFTVMCSMSILGFVCFIGESSGGKPEIPTVAGSAGGCDGADAAAAATVC